MANYKAKSMILASARSSYSYRENLMSVSLSFSLFPTNPIGVHAVEDSIEEFAKRLVSIPVIGIEAEKVLALEVAVILKHEHISR